MDMTFTLSELKETAEHLLQRSGSKRVFALHGEMGAGKKTFVQALCEILGVIDRISSPTFPIINEYQTNAGETIFHIDLYRLKGAEEAVQAGVEEALNSGDTCFVEWPGRAPEIFPAEKVDVYFEVVNETTRRIRIGDN